MHSKILIFFGLFLSWVSFSQLIAQDADSLKSVLQQKLHDTTRLSVLSVLVDVADESEWLSFNRQMLELASEKLKKTKKDEALLYREYMRYYALAIHNMGVNHLNRSELRLAENYFRKSMLISQSIWDRESEVYSGIELAKVLYTQRRFKEAIALNYQNLRFQEKQKDVLGIGESYNGIADIYFALNQFHKAVPTYKQSYRYYQKAQYADGCMASLIDLGTIYLHISKYDSAQFYLNMAETIDYDEVSPYSLAMLYTKQGLVHQHFRKWSDAIAAFRKAMQLSVSLNDPILECHSQLGLSSVYRDLQQIPKAISYGEGAWKVVQQFNLPIEGEKVTRWLYQLYKQSGQTAKALQMLEHYAKYVKNKNTFDENNKLVEEQLQFEFEKKELLAKNKRDSEINRSRLRAEQAKFVRNAWILAATGILLIGLVAFLFYNQYRKQQFTITEQNNQMLKQKLLLVQMNPHFIFNALNAIQNCIYKQDALNAGNYLSEFAQLMRQILEYSRRDLITLQEEIDLMHHYLSLQRFRFNQAFEYELVLDPAIDLSVTHIPPMLSQPFLENAIEHGFRGLEEGGILRMLYRISGNQLVCEIEDNGKGFSKEQAKSKHNSLALSITRERIEFLKGSLDSQAIQIINLAELDASKSGVKVIFVLPLIRNKS